MRLHIWTDGGVTHNRADEPGPAFAAFVVHDHEGNYIGSKSHALVGTNNVAEWHGLVSALVWLANPRREGAVAWTNAIIQCDSRLIVEQFNGTWKIKDDRMKRLRETARSAYDSIHGNFPEPVVEVLQIPRSQNKEADWLCNHAKEHGPKIDFTAPIPGRG